MFFLNNKFCFQLCIRPLDVTSRGIYFTEEGAWRKVDGEEKEETMGNRKGKGGLGKIMGNQTPNQGLGIKSLIRQNMYPCVIDTRMYVRTVDQYLVGVVAGVLLDGQPTKTGILDSDVLFIILDGRGVMYDLDRILVNTLVVARRRGDPNILN